MAERINFTGTYWTITDGNWYVSYRGSDDTGDGSPSNPFATIAQAISVADTGDKIVVGTGHYTGTVDGDGKSCVIYGDGYVEMKGMGTAFFNMGASAELHNISHLYGYTTPVNGMYVLDNCFIDGGSVLGEITYVQNCIIRSLTFNPDTTSVFTELKNNTFLNVYSTTDGHYSHIGNCYWDPNCDFWISTADLLYFDFCGMDISGHLLIDGNVCPDCISVQILFPAFQVHGTDVSDPEFSDPTRLDFTLLQSSPMRYAGSDGRYIGARGVETLLSHDTLTSPSLANITVNGSNNYNVTIAGQIATLQTGVIDLGERRQLGKANLYADMLFVVNDSNFAVDDSLFASTPEILTFSLRYSDNPNRVARGKYNTYRWSELITNDATGKGNGDPVFNSPTARPVEARYVQVKITMSDTSYYLLQQNNDRMNLEDSSGKLLHTNT